MKTDPKTAITAALEQLEQLDWSKLSPSQKKMVDAAETGLTLVEAELDGHPDRELAEHARECFGIQ